MEFKSSTFLSIDQLADQIQSSGKSRENRSSVVSFQDILAGKSLEQESVRFSKHASFRMNDRGMEMTGEQLERLNDGTNKAAEKGIRESLVLIDDMAFIVNVPSRTVVTAMDQTETGQNVFTNINGAVIM